MFNIYSFWYVLVGSMMVTNKTAIQYNHDGSPYPGVLANVIPNISGV